MVSQFMVILSGSVSVAIAVADANGLVNVVVVAVDGVLNVFAVCCARRCVLNLVPLIQYISSHTSLIPSVHSIREAWVMDG